MKHKLFAVCLIALTSLAGCTTMVTTSGKIVIRDKNVSIGIVFTDRDHRLIRRYYESHHSRYKERGVPPGLAKRGGRLPHGLAKRDRLPPGLHLRGLPEDLESTLSPLSKRYVRVVVGSDVVIMDRNTRVVFDIYRAVVIN